jgi:hypothetical protein
MAWGILAAGAVLAVLLFSYATSVPMSFRVRGDAFGYMRTADGFSSLRDAFSYVGDRTYGFPLFLYVVRELSSPVTLWDWVAATSYFQFSIHIVACLFFYAAFLKGLFREAKLPAVAAPAAGALLLCYPALVMYTTVPLADTFCTDLLMMAAAARSASRKAVRPANAFLLCGICGLLLGYIVLARPSFGPAVLAFYGVSFCSLVFNKEWRVRGGETALMSMAALVLILPVMWHVWESDGSIGLQNEAFVEKSVAVSMQSGLSSVRVFWSGQYESQEPIPGIKDTYLDEVYGKKCSVDSVASLALCLFSQPQALPLYFGKKTIALFDVPHIQPYAVDLSPGWFVPLERIFGAAAFCGLVSLLIMAGLHLLSGPRPVWIGLPWTVLVLTLLLLHTLLHIEGRYGFPVVPFCLTALFLGFAGARQAGRKFYIRWLLAVLVAAVCFMYQTYSWDFVAPS